MGLSRDFLTIISAVPARQAAHVTNTDLMKKGLDPREIENYELVANNVHLLKGPFV